MNHKWLQQKLNIAPLVSFRILFGAIMFFALSRNLYLGFVEKFYIKPSFFFKFYGFEWVQALGATATWLLYGLMLLSVLSIMLGAWYRIGTIVFFVLFSYFELLDLTHYLNHYYLICLLAFLLCYLPANRRYAIDVWRKPQLRLEEVPRWSILILQVQIGLLYFYAGLAKLQPDWLLSAQPLSIWLARQSDFPLIGTYLAWPFTAHLFSWFGALYDLSIPFLLSWKRSRAFAYLAVIVFHILTALLFNIGIFPIAMMAFALIFFSGVWHQKIISTFVTVFILTLSKLKYADNLKQNSAVFNVKMPWFLWLFIVWQLLFPLRHWLYPGNVLWTEEGFRFAWKVMVVEKTGTAIFKVRDPESGLESEVNNRDYLSAKQEVFMSYQPDLILQFAHHLAADFKNKKGYKNPEVTVDCFVSLNGRPARRFIDPKVNLAKEKANLWPKSWIIQYNDL
jgi:hypothetical protein